ncbi:MAG: inorganic diphosphatase [Candidatus Omnitrophica bacterium]|nr:inorganic diphosphatase [Candidatus Omnitrophota bacterium]
MKTKGLFLIFALVVLGVTSECLALQQNRYELRGEKNFFTGYESVNPDGTINAVIEISAGDNEKWEVQKDDGVMRWGEENGRPRLVEYLGYPVNYGMVPKTVLSGEKGGDGDPLDILVIGRQLKRGQVIKAKLIGVLRMTSEGMRDDKLLAVLPDTHFGDIKSVHELNEKFPGVTSIIETWFINYEGQGKVQTEGFGSLEEADLILNSAREAYNVIKH